MALYTRARALWGHSPDATSLIRQPDVEQWDRALLELKSAGGLDPREYGTVDLTGATASTSAMAAVYADAYTYSRPVIALPGTILTDTINYKGQPTLGFGRQVSVMKGLARKDIFHFDASIAYASIPNLAFKGVTLIVNDGEDASADFSQRGGSGNAAIAIDWANGAAATQLGLYLSTFEDVKFSSTSGVAAGQNKSCGIYCQGIISQCSFTRVQFWRLAYGFRHDYPTSNVSTIDFGGDHNQYNSLYFNGCNRPFRLVNPFDCEFGTLTIHSANGLYGFQVTNVVSGTRRSGGMLKFGNVMIEEGAAAAMTNAWDVPSPTSDVTIDTFNYQATPTLNIASDETTIDNLAGGGPSAPYLILDGDRITVRGWAIQGTATAAYAYDLVTDNGYGNSVEAAKFTGAVGSYTNLPQHLTRDSRILHARDAASILLGHAGSTLMVGGDDLLVNPLALWDQTGTEVTDWDYVQDATSEFGWVYRRTTSAGSDFTASAGPPIFGPLNGNQGWFIGKFLPATALQVLICWKAATGGTMVWYVQAPSGTTVGTATLTVTTSYAVSSFTADLAGKTAADTLRLVSNPLAGGGAYPLSIAWVAFRPYTKDQYIANSTEPVTPVGGGVVYVQSGDLKYKGSSGVISKLGVADPFNTQTGTAYTLVLADSELVVGMNNAAANTLTVPPNASVAFPVGTIVTVRQVGAGLTTVAAGSGVTLHSRGAVLNLAGQYAYATLIKVATNTWELSGDIA